MTLPLLDPRRAAFTAETHALLHEFLEDFRTLTGRELPGRGSGVLFAHDFLLESARDRTPSWDDLDSLALMGFAVDRGFTRALPAIIADVACFTMFLRDTDRIAPETADLAEESLRLVRRLIAARPGSDGGPGDRRRSEAS